MAELRMFCKLLLFLVACAILAGFEACVIINAVSGVRTIRTCGGEVHAVAEAPEVIFKIFPNDTANLTESHVLSSEQEQLIGGAAASSRELSALIRLLFRALQFQAWFRN